MDAQQQRRLAQQFLREINVAWSGYVAHKESNRFARGPFVPDGRAAWGWRCVGCEAGRKQFAVNERLRVGELVKHEGIGTVGATDEESVSPGAVGGGGW